MHWEEGDCWALGFSSPGGFPKSVVLTGGERCGAGGPGVLGESGAAWVGLEGSCTMSCPQVVLRIRPLNDAELEEGATVIAHKVEDQVRLWAQYVHGVQHCPSHHPSPQGLPPSCVHSRNVTTEWPWAEPGQTRPIITQSLSRWGGGQRRDCDVRGSRATEEEKAAPKASADFEQHPEEVGARWDP